jgi:hypothetical protein
MSIEPESKLTLSVIFLFCLFAFFIADRIDKNMPASDKKILLKLQIEEKKLQLMRLKGDGNCKT